MLQSLGLWINKEDNNMKEFKDVFEEMIEETKMAFSDFAILCGGLAILIYIVAASLLQIF